jgi:chemotaxis protein CheC
MILAFDEASGQALVEMLVDDSSVVDNWDELAQSAVLETTNIVCCAYLNALAERFSTTRESAEIVPTAPEFMQEFAESLLEFVLMDQATAGNMALVAKTRFEVDATPLHWTLLFLPDAESMQKIMKILSPGTGLHE